MSFNFISAWWIFIFKSFFPILVPNPCASNPSPCVHGVCYDAYMNIDQVEVPPEGFICHCYEGYFGINCQCGYSLVSLATALCVEVSLPSLCRDFSPLFVLRFLSPLARGERKLDTKSGCEED